MSEITKVVFAELLRQYMAGSAMQGTGWLSPWRLNFARSLRRDGKRKLREAVGYESEALFSTAFPKTFGMAPGRWRRGTVDRIWLRRHPTDTPSNIQRRPE